MGGQYIFHILYSNLFFRNHAPWQIIRIWSKFCIYAIPDFCLRIQVSQHIPCTRSIINMVGIVMASERISWIQYTIQGKIQVIFADKFFQVSRTHVFQIRIFLTWAPIFFLIPQCFFQVKFINSKLIWHYHICLIRNLSCHPVMAADSFQPPDFILILESNSIHLIGSVFLQNASKTDYPFAGAMDVWKNNGYNIFLSDSTCCFLLTVLCRLIGYQRIRAKYPGIGGNRFCSSHSHICLIYTACCPDSFAVYCIWHRCIAHWIIWKINFHMRNHRFIFPRLFLWMNHHKFFGHIMSRTGIIISCNHGRAIIRCLFSN